MCQIFGERAASMATFDEVKSAIVALSALTAHETGTVFRFGVHGCTAAALSEDLKEICFVGSVWTALLDFDGYLAQWEQNAIENDITAMLGIERLLAAATNSDVGPLISSFYRRSCRRRAPSFLRAEYSAAAVGWPGAYPHPLPCPAHYRDVADIVLPPEVCSLTDTPVNRILCAMVDALLRDDTVWMVPMTAWRRAEI